MFVLIAGQPGTSRKSVLEAMGGRLRGGDSPVRLWHDAAARGGAAAIVAGILPEDTFDVQPLVTEDLVFVCRVRLDYRDDLSAKLHVPARQAERLADSNLLELAYQRWGSACVQQLSGDYAFAAWHRREDRVVAAVDHLGSARLFWSRFKDGLLLSGQLAALVAHPSISTTPDFPALARLFDMGIDRTATPFESVRALPGGHFLEWGRGAPRITRWWRPTSHTPHHYRDSNEYLEQARELFDRAVASRLRAAGSISTTLSGGLDSGLVTATAARQLRRAGRCVTAYTSIPVPGLRCAGRVGWESDDGPYAAAVAALHDNVEHVLVSPDGRCTLDLLPDFHRYARTPTRSVTNFLWLSAFSASIKSAGSRVLLIGHRGNASVSWRGTGATEELLAEGQWRLALGQVRLEARAYQRRPWRVLAAALLSTGKSAGRRVIGMVPVANPPGLAFLRKEHWPTSRLGAFAERPGTRTYWSAFATTPSNIWWPDPIAQWGVEWRDPTADRQLMECLLSFPLYAFRNGGLERGLARAMARGLLPDHVRLRRTQGAQVPELSSLIALHAKRY